MGYPIHQCQDNWPIGSEPLTNGDVGGWFGTGPLVNLEYGFERTIHAFRDWSRILFEHGILDRYADQETSLEAFGEALVQGLRAGLTTTHPLGLQEALFTWIGWTHLLINEENRAIDLAEVKEVPLIKETFYQNPKLQYLTEIEEWQALCTLKTHPRTARIHHAVWMLTRNKIFFTTRTGFNGNWSVFHSGGRFYCSTSRRR